LIIVGYGAVRVNFDQASENSCPVFTYSQCKILVNLKSFSKINIDQCSVDKNWAISFFLTFSAKISRFPFALSRSINIERKGNMGYGKEKFKNSYGP